MAAVILEILARGRGQPQYRRVRQFPYSIGRAYDNDLILNDESVSAHHLQLEKNAHGELLVRNLSHENGTQVTLKTPRQRAQMGFVPVLLTLPCQLQLGHTALRVLTQDTAVAATRRQHYYPGPMQLAARLPYALLLLLFVQALNVLAMLNNPYITRTGMQVILQQMPQVLSPLFIATITGFISRLLLHRWQFALQLSIACIAMLLLMVTNELQHWTSYYYSSDAAGQLVFYLLAATLFTALFTWQLRAFSVLSQQRATVSALAISWPLLLVLWLQGVVHTPDFVAQPDMQTALRSIDQRQEPTLDIDHFIDAVQSDLQSSEDSQ